MRVTINGSGGIVTHGDSLSGGGVIEFPINEPPEFAATLANYTVTGSAPSRKLKDRGHEIAVESPTSTAERAPSTGGSSLTVAGPDGSVLNASTVRAAAVVDAGGGTAVLPGFGLMLIASVDADVLQTVPPSDAFTLISLPVHTYDPYGYWSTALPTSGHPGGVLVPTGFGGIHRVRLVAMTRVTGSDAEGLFHAAIGFMSYSDSGDSFGWTADEATNVLGGQDVTLIAEFVGQMDAAEEAYFYAKHYDPGTGATAMGLRWPTFVTVERLTSAA